MRALLLIADCLIRTCAQVVTSVSPKHYGSSRRLIRRCQLLLVSGVSSYFWMVTMF